MQVVTANEATADQRLLFNTVAILCRNVGGLLTLIRATSNSSYIIKADTRGMFDWTLKA
jgi:hypothetical protein